MPCCLSATERLSWNAAITASVSRAIASSAMAMATIFVPPARRRQSAICALIPLSTLPADEAARLLGLGFLQDTPPKIVPRAMPNPASIGPQLAGAFQGPVYSS